MDIYANGKLICENLYFGCLSKYKNIPPDKYDIEIYDSGSKSLLIFKKTLEFLPNNISTICINSTKNDSVEFLILNDIKNDISANSSYLRFINISIDCPLISLSIKNKNTLFKDVEYMETTRYYPLPGGNYNFTLSSNDNTCFNRYINNIFLKEGNCYTLFIIGLLKDDPKLGYLLSQDVI